MRVIILLIFGISLVSNIMCGAKIGLDECMHLAEENYPLIKKYDLISKTEDVSLAEINKMWLPSATVYLQGTLQNRVPEFPSTLNNILTQMGTDMTGLGKIQYKVGVDVSQTIWDGGVSKSKRISSRAASEEREASLQTTMYGVREKVLSLYFGVLLIEQQVQRQENRLSLLKANHEKLKEMYSNGVAMASDVDNIEAQILSGQQQLIQAVHAKDAYKKMLGIYIGKDPKEFQLLLPSTPKISNGMSMRPELKMYAAGIKANQAKKGEIASALNPKIGAFVQGFYGYPGFNNFESMMRRNPSFNIVGGIRATWNIAPLYTKKESLTRLELANKGIEIEREVFLFNNNLAAENKREEIEGLRESMNDDKRIIELRTSVRKSAETQLENGVIDVTALLAKINDETEAAMAAKYHELELLKKLYELKLILNQ